MTAITQARQSVDALAAEIHREHAACDTFTAGVTSDISAAIQKRVSIARLVETAHATIGTGGAFARWWRDQNLPAGWAARYLRLARTAGRSAIGDKDQLRLIGLIPEAQGGNAGQQRQRNRFDWITWAGKIKTRLSPEAIKDMSEFDRQAAAKQLQPLVELYRQLNGDAS